MKWNGGGWTMVLHSMWGGCVHSDPAYRQSYNDWEDLGINKADVDRYANSVSGNAFLGQASCYFLPLKYWKAMATKSSGSGARQLVVRSNNDRSFIIEGLHMTDSYALRCTNTAQVRQQFCRSPSS